MMARQTSKIFTIPGLDEWKNEAISSLTFGIQLCPNKWVLSTAEGLALAGSGAPKTTAVMFCIKKADIPVAAAAPPIRTNAKMYRGM